jgi:hypothetical protein
VDEDGEPDGRTGGLDGRRGQERQADDEVARLDHFVVGDDLSVFSVADLRCVPIAERAIQVVPGVDEVEPAGETFERVLREGRELG